MSEQPPPNHNINATLLPVVPDSQAHIVGMSGGAYTMYGGSNFSVGDTVTCKGHSNPFEITSIQTISSGQQLEGYDTITNPGISTAIICLGSDATLVSSITSTASTGTIVSNPPDDTFDVLKKRLENDTTITDDVLHKFLDEIESEKCSGIHGILNQANCPTVPYVFLALLKTTINPNSSHVGISTMASISSISTILSPVVPPVGLSTISSIVNPLVPPVGFSTISSIGNPLVPPVGLSSITTSITKPPTAGKLRAAKAAAAAAVGPKLCMYRNSKDMQDESHKTPQINDFVYYYVNEKDINKEGTGNVSSIDSIKCTVTIADKTGKILKADLPLTKVDFWKRRISYTGGKSKKTLSNKEHKLKRNNRTRKHK
jgi:hypothetical protein